MISRAKPGELDAIRVDVMDTEHLYILTIEAANLAAAGREMTPLKCAEQKLGATRNLLKVHEYLLGEEQGV